MKLWILRPVENRPVGDDPWEPWYDKCFGFVIRSETADGARRYAQAGAGDEQPWHEHKRDETKPWLDPKYSTCEELTVEGDAGIVIQDFRAA